MSLIRLTFYGRHCVKRHMTIEFILSTSPPILLNEPLHRRVSE
jgi:hypothetical protein